MTGTEKTPKNSTYIKFTDKMKDRINKIQKPILSNVEEYQRVQIGGAETILDGYQDRILAVLYLMGAINNDFLEEDEEGRKCFSREFWAKFHTLFDDEHHKHVELVIAGMQVSATNYVGLVLEGKMRPIFDPSLDNSGRRDTAIKSIKDVCENVGTMLAEKGMLEENTKGEMRIKQSQKLFMQVGDKEDEQERSKR